MRRSRAIGELLRVSVARDATPRDVQAVLRGVQPGELDGLATTAVFHGVAGYVHAAVRGRPEVPDDEQRELTAQRQRTAFHHLRAIGHLRTVRGALDAAEVPWIVVKGPTLGLPVHGHPELRSYADLDVLVPPPRLGDAVAALERAGCRLLDRNWTLILREMKGEVHLRLPLGTELDLHWHLLNNTGPRGAYTVPLPALFARARGVEVGSDELPTLAVADTIVYVALHAMLSGGDRLVWMKDLERLLTVETVDVDELASCAREWRAELALTSALSRVERSVGLPPIAAAIRRRLRPNRTWRVVTAAAWRLSPAQHEDGGGSSGRMVARSVRPTQRASFAELARKVGHQLRSDGRGGRGPDDEVPDDELVDDDLADAAGSDASSDRFASGGEPAKRAFLDAVAREG